MAIIWLKTIVATAGTAGPLLGDGVNTTTTVLAPASTGNQLKIDDSMGGLSSVLNQSTKVNQFAANKLYMYPRKGNTGAVYVGATGSAQADKVSQPQPGTAVNPFFTLGDGDRRTVNLGDVEVDAANSGEGWVWCIEAD